MTHFEHMEQKGQMTIFDLMDEIELNQFKKSSTDKKKIVANNQRQPRKIGFVIRA